MKEKRKRMFIPLLLAAALGGGALAQEIQTADDLARLIQENPFRVNQFLIQALMAGLPIEEVINVMRALEIPLVILFELLQEGWLTNFALSDLVQGPPRGATE